MKDFWQNLDCPECSAGREQHYHQPAKSTNIKMVWTQGILAVKLHALNKYSRHPRCRFLVKEEWRAKRTVDTFISVSRETQIFVHLAQNDATIAPLPSEMKALSCLLHNRYAKVKVTKNFIQHSKILALLWHFGPSIDNIGPYSKRSQQASAVHFPVIALLLPPLGEQMT